jgi:hypothetical protein
MSALKAILLCMATDKTKLVSLRVSESDYSKLTAQAAVLGLKPAVFARVLLRTSLNAPRTAPRRHSREEFRAAVARLDRLAAKRGDQGADAVELIHRARDDRERRRAEILGLPPPSPG